LGRDLWLGLSRCGPVVAWGGQRAAAKTLDHKDESIGESLAAANSLLLLFFLLFLSIDLPENASIRSCRTIHQEQSPKLTLPICQSKPADLKIDQGRTIRRSTENTHRD
jgi:hypothetical protein